MKYYSVGQLTFTDRGWARSYVEHVTAMVERHGGRYLARTSDFEVLESSGHEPQMFVVIEWPSKEAARAFYESEEYRPFMEGRRKGSNGSFVLIPGEDINGTARIS